MGPAVGRAQTTPAAGRTSPAAADTVASVTVSGNVTVDGELILRAFGLPVGTRYSTDAVRRGIRRLYDLGFFSDVAVEGSPVPGGLALEVRVVEIPRVGTIEFAGNKEIKDKDLLEGLGNLVGRMADDRTLTRVSRKVAQLYEQKGYSRAEVKPRYLAGDSETRRILLVEVTEGPKVRVEAVRFLGLARLRADDLRGAMEQGTKGFLKGGVYKPEVLAEDPPRIQAEMAKRGFRDGKVEGYEVVPGSREDRVVVEIKVSEGPRYTVGDVTWEGNKVLSTRALFALTRVETGAVFNQENIDKTLEEAYGAYAEQGYIYLGVQPDFTAVDSTVSVRFKVTEGEPSHVRDVLITGNTRTKERVIRRQLAIRPGDLFRRNALVRSQRELQQLGFFTNVIPTSKPVPNSNDIDITFEMEEKQVGTASAGFGFSSAVGLTGFMELGHPNLFGNGQSMNLRMERGSQRNNAELSFTEPWFRGSPTSVGLDFFSTNRIYRGTDLDLEIRRVGGAVRLGRPLPLAYTRLFASYGLENQTVVDETNTTASTDTSSTITATSYLTGFRLSQETALTSRLTFNLIRNSTDHPLYPTVGSSASLSTEFSGGPLGGDQVYQKYQLDVSRYLSTVHLKGWNPVLMPRLRVGAVGEAFRDTPLLPDTYLVESAIPPGATYSSVDIGTGGTVELPVPRHILRFTPESNELFRMGGTTYDALRGYDDYEIVPSDNVTRRFLVQRYVERSGPDSAAVYDTTYTVSPSTVYYPGGKYMAAFTLEWQFPIAEPLHGLLFTDWGGTWSGIRDFRWDSIHRSVGVGFRMEVPLLGLIGFDYGYGFDRLDRATGRYDGRGGKAHIQFGRIF
jgi:outer membrane protein insertion porin family